MSDENEIPDDGLADVTTREGAEALLAEHDRAPGDDLLSADLGDALRASLAREDEVRQQRDALRLPQNARVLTATEWNDLVEEYDEKLGALRRERDEALGEISRVHKLLLERTGSTSSEPLASIVGRWLDQLSAEQEHHEEHHAREKMLTAERDEARAEVKDYDRLLTRLRHLLAGVAGGLKGRPEPLAMHDWSDLPRIAVETRRVRDAARAEMERLRREVERLTAVQSGQLATAEECARLRAEVERLRGRDGGQ